MKALLIKDLLIQKRWLPFYGLYSLFFYTLFGIVSDPPDVSIIMVLCSIIIACIIVAGSFRADKNDTPRLLLSMPILRREVVGEKFILLFLAAAYGYLSTYLLSLLFRVPGIAFVVGKVDPLDIVRILSGVFLLTILLPVYFRFGQLAIRYFLAGLVVAGLAAQLGMLFLIRAASSRGANLIDMIVGWFTRIPVVERNLIIFGIGLAAAVLSYAVSIAIYTRKDL